MSEQLLQTIIDSIADLKAEMKQGFAKNDAELQRNDAQLQVIDKRLYLIEQRLNNIEKWVPVDHKDLHFQASH